jgi:hypothetical protein
MSPSSGRQKGQPTVRKQLFGVAKNASKPSKPNSVPVASFTKADDILAPPTYPIYTQHIKKGANAPTDKEASLSVFARSKHKVDSYSYLDRDLRLPEDHFRDELQAATIKDEMRNIHKQIDSNESAEGAAKLREDLRRKIKELKQDAWMFSRVT